jgi:aquaporin NIP
MNKYFSEFIGTFILLFAGTGVVVVNQEMAGVVTLPGIAACWGLIIIATVYAFGDISGNHINPAVTIAFAADKRFEWKQVPAYLAAQLSGALTASFLLHYLFPANEMLGATQPSGSVLQSFILEAVMTFILLIIILRVSTGAKEKGITAGIVIGSTVAFLVLFGGPISGTSINPTRSIAPAIVSGHLENLWIYIAAPITGALLAIPAHNLLNK